MRSSLITPTGIEGTRVQTFLIITTAKNQLLLRYYSFYFPSSFEQSNNNDISNIIHLLSRRKERERLVINVDLEFERKMEWRIRVDVDSPEIARGAEYRKRWYAAIYRSTIQSLSPLLPLLPPSLDIESRQECKELHFHGQFSAAGAPPSSSREREINTTDDSIWNQYNGWMRERIDGKLIKV